MARVSDAHLEARRKSILAAATKVFSQKGISSATMAAVSKSICWLMLAMMPLRINSLMTSIGLTCIKPASSRTVIKSGISMAVGVFVIGICILF